MPLQMRGGTGGIISAIETGNSTAQQIENQQGANKNVVFRLDGATSPVYRTFALTSTRLNVDNSQFWANEYGIPTPGSSLDITFPDTAATVSVASTSIEDVNTTGDGAHLLVIEGLDENYAEIFEVVAMNGQTKVESVNTYFHVQNLAVFTSGTTGWNEGTIYCGDSTQTFTLGVPQTTVYRTIGVDTLDGKGIGATNISTYMVPAGFIGCPTIFKSDTDATTAKPLLIRGIVQPFLFGALLGEITIGNLVFNGSQEFTFDGFANLEAKSRMIIRSRAKGATSVDTSILYWEWTFRRLDA